MASKIIYFVAFTDIFCIALIVPLIVPHILSLGSTVLVSGITESICGGLQFIGAPIVGSWSDNVGWKKVFFYTTSISLLSNIILASSSSYLGLFLIARLLNSTTHHIQVLLKAITVDLIPEKEQVNIFNNIGALVGLAFTLGPVVGGLLYGVYGNFLSIVIIINTLYLICIGAITLLEEKQKVTKPKTSNSGIIENIKKINWNILWDVFLFKLLTELAFALWRSMFVILMREVFDIPTSSLGYVIGFTSAIMVLGNIFMPKIRSNFFPEDKSGQRQIRFGIAAFLIGFILMPFTYNFALYLLLCIPMTTSKILLDTVWMEILLNRSKNDNKGVVIGTADSLMSLSNFLSPMTVGIVAEFAGLKIAQYLPVIATAFSFPLINKLTKKIS